MLNQQSITFLQYGRSLCRPQPDFNHDEYSKQSCHCVELFFKNH